MKSPNHIANFVERKITVEKAISILGRNGIKIDDLEASVILDMLYHLASSFDMDYIDKEGGQANKGSWGGE